ncbi:hypothetical protein ACFQ60_27280 [Streptomyces zhihengii]
MTGSVRADGPYWTGRTVEDPRRSSWNRPGTQSATAPRSTCSPHCTRPISRRTRRPASWRPPRRRWPGRRGPGPGRPYSSGTGAARPERSPGCCWRCSSAGWPAGW